MHVLLRVLTHLAHSHLLARHLAFFFSGKKRVLREWEFLNMKKREFVAMLGSVNVPGPEVGEEDEGCQGADTGRPDFPGCARGQRLLPLGLGDPDYMTVETEMSIYTFCKMSCLPGLEGHLPGTLRVACGLVAGRLETLPSSSSTDVFGGPQRWRSPAPWVEVPLPPMIKGPLGLWK